MSNNTMTDEQMRIAIAEACGWHEEKEPVGSANATAWWHHNDRYPSYLMPLPDYLNDLNAMHEAEKVLNGGQINTYLGHLYRNSKPASVGANPWKSVAVRVAVHATARQRCIAFLKTKGIIP